MGERTVLMQSAMYRLAGVDGSAVLPFLPYQDPASAGPARVLGQQCRGQAVKTCLAIFGCDEPTLERVACRTCPN